MTEPGQDAKDSSDVMPIPDNVEVGRFWKASANYHMQRDSLGTGLVCDQPSLRLASCQRCCIKTQSSAICNQWHLHGINDRYMYQHIDHDRKCKILPSQEENEE